MTGILLPSPVPQLIELARRRHPVHRFLDGTVSKGPQGPPDEADLTTCPLRVLRRAAPVVRPGDEHERTPHMPRDSDNPRPEKVAVVEEVRGRFDASTAALLTEYRGLNVTAMAELTTRHATAEKNFSGKRFRA